MDADNAGPGTGCYRALLIGRLGLSFLLLIGAPTRRDSKPVTLDVRRRGRGSEGHQHEDCDVTINHCCPQRSVRSLLIQSDAPNCRQTLLLLYALLGYRSLALVRIPVPASHVAQAPITVRIPLSTPLTPLRQQCLGAGAGRSRPAVNSIYCGECIHSRDLGRCT